VTDSGALSAPLVVTGKAAPEPGLATAASARRPIAFFLPSLRGGGAERVVANLVQGIARRGLPVDVVLAAAEGAFLDQLPPAVRLVDLRASRVLQTLRPLSRYLRSERPRILISSMHHANLVALWAARLAGQQTPVIVTVHSTLSQTHRRDLADRWLWPHLIRAFYPRARGIVAVSSGTADDLARAAKIPRERIQVIYNPVITPAMDALARQLPEHPWFAAGQPPVILGVGRLTWAKDFSTLIRAFSQLRQRRPVRLIILGEGKKRSALTALAKELGVADDVALPGFRPNALAFMANSALFVLSSVLEALPTVLIEALAVGARVVSTDCPNGPREILQHGRLGSLVPVGDVAAMSAAMLDALDRPASAVSLEPLAPFTQDAAVDHYLRLIKDME
jgi:glycosyltransferase involved in cell wall biosynthesis